MNAWKLMLFSIALAALWFTVGLEIGILHGRVYRVTVTLPIANPAIEKKPAVVMRDARIICLSAILHRTERDNWVQMSKAMARSPNVCTVAAFLYPRSDIPERMPLDETEVAIQAVDNG